MKLSAIFGPATVISLSLLLVPHGSALGQTAPQVERDGGIVLVTDDRANYADDDSSCMITVCLTEMTAGIDIQALAADTGALTRKQTLNGRQTDLVAFTFDNGVRVAYIPTKVEEQFFGVHSFYLDLGLGISASCPYDMNNTQLSTLLCHYMRLFADNNLRRIDINGVPFAVSAPTARCFREMFSAGIAELDDKSWYAGYLNGKPAGGTRQNANAAAGRSIEPSVKRSGNLSAREMITRPFGFITGDLSSMSRSYIGSKLRSAEFDDESDPKLICIINCDTSHIPYTYRDRQIAVMSAFFVDRLLKSFDYKISIFKTDIDQDGITALARELVEELSGIGIEFSEPDSHYGFYSRTGLFNGWEVTVEAHECSKAAVLDSYGVTLQLWKQL